MDRGSFGRWGIELAPDEFAQALAAYGLLTAVRSTRVDRLDFAQVETVRSLMLAIAAARIGVGWLDLEFAGDRVRVAAAPDRSVALQDIAHGFTAAMQRVVRAEPAIPERRGLVAWAVPRQRQLVAPQFAAELAQAWRNRVQLPIRLEVKPADWGSQGPAWLLEQLSSEAVGADSVYLRLPEPPTGSAGVRWEWPLRVGVLDAPDSPQLRQTLAQHHWAAGRETPLVKIIDPTAGEDVCDLLLSPFGLRGTLSGLLQRHFRAGFVLMSGGLDDEWAVAEPLMTALLARVRAGGVGFAQPLTDIVGWFEWFIEVLSHDAGLDVALTVASRQLQLAPPILVAQRRLIDLSRMRSIVTTMSAHAESMAPQMDAEMDPAAPALPEIPDLADWDFSMESEGATEAATIAGEVDAVADSVARMRWIQARVWDETGQRRRQLRSAFRANTTHMVDVWIGPAEHDAIAATVPFPDDLLPRSDLTHRLTVVFTLFQGGMEPSIQTRHIQLPQVGSSDRAQFYVHTAPTATRIEARITVLHRYRVLQTAMLRSRVVADPLAGGTEPPISLTAEAVVRARLHDLGQRRPFDAALVVNHDDDGRTRITSVTRDGVHVTTDTTLDVLLETARSWLERIVKKPEQYERIDSPQTVKLLIDIARKGNALYQKMVIDQGQRGQTLKDALRLQVVSVREDSFLPIEFVYDRPVPKANAKLCPNARVALENGACSSDCLPSRDIVCPLGFWCMQKVIERYKFDAEVQRTVQTGFAVWPEPTAARNSLGPLAELVFVASDRVDKVLPDSLNQLGTTLTQSTGGRAKRSMSWQDWPVDIAATKPAMLVILPHTVVRSREAGLEVGAIDSSPLLTQDFLPEHVRVDSDTRDKIVLLLGCETAIATDVISAFAPIFRRNGAAIILTTLSRILGRHAAPVAGQLIEEIVARSNIPGQTFGDVMLDIRRSLLAQGVPMVLALVAYGDADWRLG